MVYERTHRQGELRRTRSRSGLTLIEGIVVAVILLLLIAFLMPPMRNARGAARRTQCKNNLKMIGLALHNYATDHGAFPPAYTVDERGQRLHSWRTLILPYLDQKDLYAKIDLSKPWDDPVNTSARQTAVTTYLCPEVARSFETTYLAVVTPESFLQPTKPAKVDEIKDGTSETLMVIEVPAAKAVHWMDPSDADDSLLSQIFSLPKPNHETGTHAGLVDGSVRFLGKNIPASTLHALITASGKDVVGDF